MYFVISFAGNIILAIFAGIKFARALNILKHNKDDDRDPVLPFCLGLATFAVPFRLLINDKLGSTVSLFIALTAMTMIIANASMRK